MGYNLKMGLRPYILYYDVRMSENTVGLLKREMFYFVGDGENMKKGTFKMCSLSEFR